MKTVVLSLATVLLLSACGTAPENKAPVTDGTPTNSSKTENPLQDKPAPTADFKAGMQLTTDVAEGKVGQTVTVRILVSQAKQPVTTANALLRFDPNLMEVSKVDVAESQWTLSFRNEYDNKAGTVTLNRSEPAGVLGDDKLLAAVTFKVLKEGRVILSLDPDQTTLLLESNARVTPAVADLPAVPLELKK